MDQHAEVCHKLMQQLGYTEYGEYKAQPCPCHSIVQAYPISVQFPSVHLWSLYLVIMGARRWPLDRHAVHDTSFFEAAS